MQTMTQSLLSVKCLSCRSAARRFVARHNCVVQASLQRDPPQPADHNTISQASSDTISLSRRQALLGIGAAAVASSAFATVVAPLRVLAKAPEDKQANVINEPAALKAQLESTYQQWGAGQYDKWLGSQSESIKWQSSYNGTVLKLKGTSGVKQYFMALNADLDLKSYKVSGVSFGTHHKQALPLNLEMQEPAGEWHKITALRVISRWEIVSGD
ncbi:hypothetical protein Agub_g8837 [Astrephomene gubernaculifera]|uniref:Uncharacterized protein n=1 Tax=Astrephomene gubernaculifera TaxID=47775 RepID=A0AAD3DWP1_9CHLO|nr:hypothetical protein Agub_g8837 [Astrephomene gubernaculifera]